MIKNTKKILVLAICLLSSSLFAFMNSLMATAWTDMVPDPNNSQPGILGSERWEFDLGDVVSYKTSMYTNGSLMGTMIDTYNISDALYEYNSEMDGIFYWIETTKMFWNASLNQLQEIPYEHYNMSLVNFTTYLIYYSDYGEPYPPLFIPHNGSTGLHLAWTAQTLLTMYGMHFTYFGGSPQVSIVGNSIYIDDAASVVDTYLDLHYFSNGTLETGEHFFDYSLMGYGTQTYNITRNYDVCPVDEVEWNKEVGDIFYGGVGTKELKINITEIVNETDEDFQTLQIVYGNVTQWNFTTESWEPLENHTQIGMANEEMFYPAFILPKGKKISEFASQYKMMYDVVYYDDYYMYVEDENMWYEMSYFPDGTLQYRNGKEYYYDMENYTVNEEATYNWIDISTTGTYMSTISNADDDSESISLLWELPFYENSYDEIYVSSNGWMSFENEYPDDWSGEIPEDEEQCVALFWDDLDPSWGGDIYYEFLSSPDRLIIQYEGVSNINEDLAGTFQVILYSTGDIKFQYEDVQNIDGSDVTIGLDNGNYEYYSVYENINSSSIPIANDAVYFTYNPPALSHIENMTYYYKNMTTYSSSVQKLEYSPFLLGDNFNITVDFQLTDTTDVFFSGFPGNPTNYSLPFGEEMMFMDFMVNESVNLMSPYDITIDYNKTLNGIYYLWIYNDTLDLWELLVDVDQDFEGSLMAQVDHNSIFGLSAILGDDPGPFTASSPDAGDPDDDGIFTIAWTNSDGANYYDLYTYHKPITEINSSLTLIDSNMVNNSRKMTELAAGAHYYVLAAYNTSGRTLSNNVLVDVLFPGDPPGATTLSTSDAGTPDDDGTFTLDWTPSDGATSYSLYWSYNTIDTVGEGTLIESGLTNNSRVVHMSASGTYHFAIVAINASGSTLSNDVTVDVLYPPGTFNLLTDAGTPDEDGSYSLSWSASTDAENYSVYLFDKPITEYNSSITILADENGISPLAINTVSGTYYYAIEAKNEVGATMSNWIMVEVSIPPEDFNLYTNASDPDTNGLFELTWDASVGADNYSVYRFDKPITEYNGSLILQGTYQEATSPFDLSEVSGVYYYAVMAYNETGETLSNWVKVDVQIPPGPFTLSTNVTGPDYNGIFELTWTPSAGADNYSIYSFDKPITEFNNSLVLEGTYQAATSPTVLQMGAGIHYFVIIAYNETGSTLSNYEMVDVRIPPLPFTLNSNAEDPDTDGDFTLTFSSDGAENYSLYEFSRPITEINDSLTLVANQTANSPVGLSRTDGTYYYVVVAFNIYGNETSNCVKVTVSITQADDDDDDDDDDDGGQDLEIPFGHNYLLFIAIAIVSVIIYEKRRKFR